MIFDILLCGAVGFCIGKILVDAKRISDLEKKINETSEHSSDK